jgi:hypothetical protein
MRGRRTPVGNQERRAKMSDLSERIEQVKKLMGARTQGEWDYESEDYETASIFSYDQTPRGGYIIEASKWRNMADGFGGESGGTGIALPDVQFIVATANLMPLLIEDWEKQRAENAKLKGLLGEAQCYVTINPAIKPTLSDRIDQALAEGTTETMKDSGDSPKNEQELDDILKNLRNLPNSEYPPIKDGEAPKRER